MSTESAERHFIGFGALTWLYGVKPSDCIEVPEEWQDGPEPEELRHLIWLYPQHHVGGYEAMREELARGDDAFKLVEPEG
ncbi:hypothetical protein ACFW2V_12735 [Streptomyces sp. NPDC058947]|uniref:hypothetical protein n=1 Tax=Streptomyces sp. NPDC058947 TaxID=3346675 RepID=UPI0036B548AE